MKCKKCRKTIPDGSKFCNYCGAPVTANKKLYRRKDGLYEKVLIIDGKRVYFRARKESDVYKKIREYEATKAHQKEHGELFSTIAAEWENEKREQIAVSSWNQSYSFPYNEIVEYSQEGE